MSVKFFGQFLMERNVLGAKELLEALRYQESRNQKFGDYAVARGYLTKEQVARITEEQKRQDMRFGELAVELDMLTEEQVDEVLTLQKNDHLLIGEAIVGKGLLAQDVIDREIKAFRSDQAVYDTDDVPVPAGMKKPEMIKPIVDITMKMIRRIIQVEAKSDDGILMEREPEEIFSTVSLTFSGGMNCDFIMMADIEMARALAGAIIGGDASKEHEDVVIDGVREFANVICGNILAKFAKLGKQVEISIPHSIAYDGGYNLVMGRAAVKYTIATTAGMLSLLIVEL